MVHFSYTFLIHCDDFVNKYNYEYTHLFPYRKSIVTQRGGRRVDRTVPNFRRIGAVAGSATAYRAAVAGLRVRQRRWKRAGPRAEGRVLRRTQRNETGAPDDTAGYLRAVVCTAGAGRPCLRAARSLGEATMAKTSATGCAGLSCSTELHPGSSVSSRRPRSRSSQALPVPRGRRHFWHVGVVRQDLSCLEQIARRAQQICQDTKPFPGLQAGR